MCDVCDFERKYPGSGLLGYLVILGLLVFWPCC